MDITSQLWYQKHCIGKSWMCMNSLNNCKYKGTWCTKYSLVACSLYTGWLILGLPASGNVNAHSVAQWYIVKKTVMRHYGSLSYFHKLAPLLLYNQWGDFLSQVLGQCTGTLPNGNAVHHPRSNLSLWQSFVLTFCDHQNTKQKTAGVTQPRHAHPLIWNLGVRPCQFLGFTHHSKLTWYSSLLKHLKAFVSVFVETLLLHNFVQPVHTVSWHSLLSSGYPSPC